MMQLRERFLSGFLGLFSVLFLLALLFGCGADQAAQKKKANSLANLGDAMAADGNFRGGLQKLLEAARLDPENAMIYHQIALVFRSLGDYPLSLKYFRKALELQPRFPEATNNMGTVYLLMGDWKKAIACFNEAAENIQYETPQYAYNNMGLAYFKMGDHQKAIQSYERALRLIPSYTVCHINLANVYEAKGDLKQAETQYREALLYQPRNPAAHLGMAKLLMQNGNPREAKEHLIQVIKASPKGPEAGEARKLLETLQG